jgi:hypothetical protein
MLTEAQRGLLMRCSEGWCFPMIVPTDDEGSADEQMIADLIVLERAGLIVCRGRGKYGGELTATDAGRTALEVGGE